MTEGSSTSVSTIAKAFQHLHLHIDNPPEALRPLRSILQKLRAHYEPEIALAIQTHGIELAERLKKDGVTPPKEIADNLGCLISLSEASDGTPYSTSITEALQQLLKVVDQQK